MRTRKDEEYANYKEATTESRQSKRSYEQKLACNIKTFTATVFMHMSGVNKTYKTRSYL